MEKLYYNYLTETFNSCIDGRLVKTKEQVFEEKLLIDKWYMLNDMDLPEKELWNRKMKTLNKLETLTTNLSK